MAESFSDDVLGALGKLGVSRLAHFTPARNLPNILSDRELRSVRDMRNDPRAAYAVTDPERYDGHPDKISCSFEFPNVFYLKQAKAKSAAINYPNWACFLLRSEAAAVVGTLFCRRNASYGGGSLLVPGVSGLLTCFALEVLGTGGTYRRGSSHCRGAATDVQAEILIPGPISLSLVTAIVLPTEEHVVEERGRLSRLGVDADEVRWIVCEGMFDPHAVTRAVREGHSLNERVWSPKPKIGY